ncbi:hypothetical protein F5X99DRAFT_32010 [Biscogniauxia marginata]|nr:hypothetical protein F5X99DRAFT_32010 [Biscogniauxia marginata]
MYASYLFYDVLLGPKLGITHRTGRSICRQENRLWGNTISHQRILHGESESEGGREGGASALELQGSATNESRYRSVIDPVQGLAYHRIFAIPANRIVIRSPKPQPHTSLRESSQPVGTLLCLPTVEGCSLPAFSFLASRPPLPHFPRLFAFSSSTPTPYPCRRRRRLGSSSALFDSRDSSGEGVSVTKIGEFLIPDYMSQS